MRLFTLPDQSKMQVEVFLHETVVDRVRAGMAAHVSFEALPGRFIDGQVESIATVPVSDQNSETANGIAYFLGRIKLNDLPPGLRPGMSAEVAIMRGPRQGVLTVDASAVKADAGHHVCYVDLGDRFERRLVQVRHATHDLQEVLEGLAEGEQVVLNPERVLPFVTVGPETVAVTK
jgi:HlyD family secretion protein